MVYSKPEVTLSVKAAGAIQHPSSKALQQVTDANPFITQLASQAAYAADE